MTIIWDHIFKGIPEEKDFRDAHGRKTISFDVDINNIVGQLREQFCPTDNPNVLQESWVREALGTFVKVGLADKVKTNRNRYAIRFHRIKGGKTTDFLLAKLYGGTETKLDEYFETD